MTWAGLAAAALIAALLLLLPWWWRGYTQRGVARRRANVAAYRQRLAELRAEAQAGTVDAAQLPALEDELGRRLLAEAGEGVAATPRAASRLVPLLALLALLVFAAAWYALAGSWRVHELVELSRRDPEAARVQSLARSAQQLEQRIAADPDDGEAWTWLARLRFEQDDFAAAAAAYARASALAGERDADLLAARGEALAYAQGRQLAGEPAALFESALALAPDHPQALWYAGLAGLQAGDAPAAQRHWARLLKLPIDEETRGVIERALAGLGLAPTAETPAAPATRLEIDVSLAPELAHALQGGETLFIYALQPGGPPMPVAARRLPAQFPARVVLSDADSVMPSRQLSSLERWTVRARVSRSGDALSQAGDLVGERTVSRAEAGRPLALRIDRRVGGEME